MDQQQKTKNPRGAGRKSCKELGTEKKGYITVRVYRSKVDAVRNLGGKVGTLLDEALDRFIKSKKG